jgi:hypothetical protein
MEIIFNVSIITKGAIGWQVIYTMLIETFVSRRLWPLYAVTTWDHQTSLRDGQLSSRFLTTFSDQVALEMITKRHRLTENGKVDILYTLDIKCMREYMRACIRKQRAQKERKKVCREK